MLIPGKGEGARPGRRLPWPSTWPLRVAMLTPVVVVIVVSFLVTIVVSRTLAAEQLESQAQVRAAETIDGFRWAMLERARSDAVLVRVLAETAGLAAAIDDHLNVEPSLQSVLGRLGVGAISVFDSEGRLLGRVEAENGQGPWESGSRAAHALVAVPHSSGVVPTPLGLVSSASAPITLSGVMLGTVQVASVIDLSGSVKSVDGRPGDIAVFHRGQVVASTSSNVEVRHALAQARVESRDVPDLAAALGGNDLHVTANLFGDLGVVVVIVAIGDLRELANTQARIAVSRAVILGLVFCGLGMFLASRISRPLERVEVATLRLRGGDYSPIPLLSRIRELKGVTEGLNHLAAELDSQRSARARDALARQQAEEALRLSEGRFRRLAENAQDIIYRYDLDSAVGLTYVSPAVSRVLGYDPEELLSGPSILPSRCFVPPVVRPANGGDQGISTDSSVVAAYHRDGKTVWLEVRCAPVFQEDGRVVAVEGIARDVTARRLMEEELLRAQRLETAGRVAGQVAHDFNNLLTPMTVYPDLIRRALPEGHDGIELCEAMAEAAQQMVTINADLLSLGRRGRVEHDPVDLNQVLADAICRFRTDHPGVEIRPQLGSLLPLVSGSPAQLLRVAMNLLINSADALDDSGQVEVATERVRIDPSSNRYPRVSCGDYVLFKVSDNGPGIPEGIRGKVFDAFFTTKSSDTHRGSGLGLSVVQAIVGDHGGCLILDSEVERGTIFEIYFPVVDSDVSRRAAGELPRGSERVLVVDDDDAQRAAAQKLLGLLGYQVTALPSGEEALLWLQDHEADVLVLDVTMSPGLDGIETYHRILGDRPSQAAVFMSGLVVDDLLQELPCPQWTPFVPKPLSLEGIGRAVRVAIDGPLIGASAT